MTIFMDRLVHATCGECWVLASNCRVSATRPGWTSEPTLHAFVIETIKVDEPHRRQGYCRRFIESVCEKAVGAYELVIVEAVGNPILAEALMRWGWSHDPSVMDFYKVP